MLTNLIGYLDLLDLLQDLGLVAVLLDDHIRPAQLQRYEQIVVFQVVDLLDEAHGIGGQRVGQLVHQERILNRVLLRFILVLYDAVLKLVQHSLLYASDVGDAVQLIAFINDIQ